MADNKVDMAQVEGLHVALQQSFSPDASVRDPAEASIKHLKYVPGATTMLLHITEEKQVRNEGIVWFMLEDVCFLLDHISCNRLLSFFLMHHALMYLFTHHTPSILYSGPIRSTTSRGNPT